MTDIAHHTVTHPQTAIVPVTEALMRHQLLARLHLLSKTAASSRPPGRRRLGGADPSP